MQSCNEKNHYNNMPLSIWVNFTFFVAFIYAFNLHTD